MPKATVNAIGLYGTNSPFSRPSTAQPVDCATASTGEDYSANNAAAQAAANSAI